MQEKIVLIEAFSQFLSSEYAKKKIQESSYFRNKEELNENLTISREIQKFTQEIQPIYFCDLKDIRNNIELSKKEFILDTIDIYNTYNTLKQWHKIREIEIPQEIFPKLFYFIHNIIFPNHLLSNWQNAFDSEGNIADTASPELKKIRSMKKTLRQRIEKILQSQINSNDDLAEKRIAFREDRYVLPIKSIAKNRTNGIIHGFSSTGSITYMEPQEIVPINNELLSVDDLEHQEINRLLRNWSKIISEYAHDILTIINYSAELEILFAKSSFADRYRCVYGSLNNSKEIILTNVYNPFLLIKKGRAETIPISISLEHSRHGIIISGPNAGGKSAALKTLALCAEMFSLGFPIPADIAEFPFFTDILIEIGDSQSLDDELSTFSGHLYNIKNILNKCSEQTLVLIDEIAHATDPLEGEALGCAIIDELIEKKTFFAITTHYRKVKIKAFEHKNIQTYSTGFDIKTLTPLFKLFPNTIGESYALKIASRVGLTPKLIERAEELIAEKIDHTERILANIEEFEQKLREKECDLIKKEYKINEELVKMKEQQEKINNHEKKLKEQGLEQADKELSRCLRELSFINRTIKAQPKQASQKLKETQQIIHQKKSEVIQLSRRHAKNLKIGDNVFSASLNKNVIVEEINKESISVRTGILKIVVKQDDLFHTEEKRKTPVKHTKKDITPAIHSLDVHGLRAPDAIKEVEKHLYSAIVSGLNEFTIIHGKGTGILQKYIYEYLKTIPEVKQFHLATPSEGGSGKTIVYLI